MKALIMAGGQGTRRHPLTLTLPKAVVPVLHRPFLEDTFRYLLDSGITQVILTTSYPPPALASGVGTR